jgi:hypothetical protein
MTKAHKALKRIYKKLQCNSTVCAKLFDEEKAQTKTFMDSTQKGGFSKLCKNKKKMLYRTIQ